MTLPIDELLGNDYHCKTCGCPLSEPGLCPGCAPDEDFAGCYDPGRPDCPGCCEECYLIPVKDKLQEVLSK